VIEVHDNGLGMPEDRLEHARTGGIAATALVVISITYVSIVIGEIVPKRLGQHNSGKGAKYTHSRLPVKLVHVETCVSLSAALKRERRIKQMRRGQKEALIVAARGLPKKFRAL